MQASYEATFIFSYNVYRKPLLSVPAFDIIRAANNLTNAKWYRLENEIQFWWDVLELDRVVFNLTSTDELRLRWFFWSCTN